ncbi:MAG: hypothetical protein ACREGF_01130, partial [Candidatus Saccharimonadales bacterium]
MLEQNAELDQTYLQEITDQHFGDFDEQHRRAIIERMARLVELGDEGGVDIHTGDTIPEMPGPETVAAGSETSDYSSPRIKNYLQAITSNLAEAHDGQQDENEVWQAAIGLAWSKAVLAVNPEDREQRAEEMVVMSRLSGVQLDRFQVTETLAANRACVGLAVANPGGEGYISVSIAEQKIADNLIDKGNSDIVLKSLDKFQDLDHQAIADKLIDIGQAFAVADNLDKFHDLNQAVADKLIEIMPLAVCQNSGSFEDTAAVLQKLAGQVAEPDGDDMADSIIENLAKFKSSVTPDTLYSIISACAAHYSTAQKIKQLDLAGLGLSEQQVGELDSHIAQLKPELKGVKNANPYAETAGDIELVTTTKPGSEAHRLASEISRALRGPETAAEIDGLDNIKQTVEASYQKLAAELAGQIGQDEADKILGNQAGNLTNSLMPTYRRLAADYLALSSNSDKLSDINFADLQPGLESALHGATEKFLQVLKVDVPYYDKLFTEWDAKRVGQRDFQEVFLGRDGVYAYVGRRAQMQARRRAMELGSGGDWQTEMPTYLVYPRGFRDNLEPDAKQAYLAQNIKNPLAAHYYDTGFTGTIPEDIMRVMGVSQEQWESRIRLLSASKRDRTVLGLQGTKSERDQIVSTVEYNVKDEHTAEGLFRRQHPDGSETMEPFAEPTMPAERLAFRLAQQALHRHFYIG